MKMTILVGLLCFVVGSGLWWFDANSTISDGFLDGIVKGAIFVFLGFGVAFTVLGLANRRKG